MWDGKVRGRLWGDVAVGAIILLAFAAPAVLATDRLPPELTNHLWLVRVQTAAISRHLLPTYVLNADKVGVLYPLFVFYGATLFAVTGALGALLGGSAVAAFVLVTLLALAAAYGGLVWLARQLGVRSWLAHAPAVTFVASAYYITNLYGRGAWPESVATSMIPLGLAAIVDLVRAERVRARSAVLLVLAVALLAGSHNITIVLSGCIGLLALIALLPAVGPTLRRAGAARLVGIGVLIGLALALDAWFLLPGATHASQTQIGMSATYPWAVTSFFNDPGLIFDPFRVIPHQSTTPGLFVQAPDFLLAWVLVVAIATRLRSGTKRVWWAAAGLTAVLGLVVLAWCDGSVWDHLPHVIRDAQFPYRLSTYVDVLAAALVLVGALAAQAVQPHRRRIALHGLLAAAIAVSAGFAGWQLWARPTSRTFFYTSPARAPSSTAKVPRTFYAYVDYDDASQPVAAAPRKRMLTIDPSRIRSDHQTLTVDPPAGPQPFATNLGAGPYVLKIEGGLSRVGRTINGLAVLRRNGSPTGPVRISLTITGRTLTVGRLISIAALVLLALLAAWGLGRRLLRRPSRSDEPATESERRRPPRPVGRGSGRSTETGGGSAGS